MADISIIRYRIYLRATKIFGKDFVKNNINNCKIIIKDEEMELIEYYIIDHREFKNFNYKKKNILEIKLIGINKINDMSKMFEGCSTLLSIYNFNVINTTDIHGMFYNCIKLKQLPDISNWNTSNITNISYFFFKCYSLKSIPDTSEWDTSKVTKMNYLFNECRTLEPLPDISKWDISNVSEKRGMFQGCSSLLYLPDISKWDTSKINDIDFIFKGYISKWNFKNINYLLEMFFGCKSQITYLVYQNGILKDMTYFLIVYHYLLFLIIQK